MDRVQQDDHWQNEYRQSDIVIDQIVEWIALKWTKNMIFQKLRTIFKDIRRVTVRVLIRKAEVRIREKYGIDPQEYKGRQIAFYESVQRGQTFNNDGISSSTKEKLAAAERLDKLYGLENIQNIDPHELAKKIIEFKKRAEQTIGGVEQEQEQTETNSTEELNDGRSENERHGEAERKGSAEQRTQASNSDSEKRKDRQTINGVQQDGNRNNAGTGKENKTASKNTAEQTAVSRSNSLGDAKQTKTDDDQCPTDSATTNKSKQQKHERAIVHDVEDVEGLTSEMLEELGLED